MSASNHFAVYSVNCPVDGFDTSRDEFLGAYRGVTDPQVVAEGKSHNSVASGWYPIGSHQINITLEPGESKSLIFVLGYCENPEDQKFTAPNVINKKPADELLAKYQTDAQVDAALAELNHSKLQLRFRPLRQPDTMKKTIIIVPTRIVFRLRIE